MTRMPVADPGAAEVSAAQLRYALVVERFARLGLVVLVGGFVAYVAGWLPAHVQPRALPALWSLPVDEYLAATHSPTGWQWLAMLYQGDMLALAGIAILCGSSAVGLLALLPLYAAAHDRRFMFLCLLQSAVLLAAASGVLA